jgi:hypothetical protein
MTTIDDQITCVRREIALRTRCYPDWVASGRLSQAGADVELARMQGVLDTLVAIRRLVPSVQRLLAELDPLMPQAVLRFAPTDEGGDIHAER